VIQRIDHRWQSYKSTQSSVEKLSSEQRAKGPAYTSPAEAGVKGKNGRGKKATEKSNGKMGTGKGLTKICRDRCRDSLAAP